MPGAVRSCVALVIVVLTGMLENKMTLYPKVEIVVRVSYDVLKVGWLS